MRKKLAGIHLLAPLSETDIVNNSRNLDRELIVNSTIVTDVIVDTVEKTNYIVTFEYDTTLDGGTHQIRRSIPTLELLSYTGENMSGAHWVNVEDMDYHYITSGATSQQAFEELDEQLSKVCFLKHLVDGVGAASLISSNDNKTPLSTVDNSEYAFVLGQNHTLTSSNYGVILSGYDSNILSSLHSSIFNGYNNTVSHSYASFINSGRNNTIGAYTDSTFILSGMYNKIEHAADSGIIGGHDNYIYGDNNSYGSIIIGSVEGYINDSEFSIISNTANSYITGGKYNEISVSSYIEIVNSSSSTISTCTNHLILNSEYVNIFASDASSQQLNVYNSNGATIQSSLGSYIWYSTNVGISNSSGCSIGYDEIPAAVSSISKTTSNLGISSVTNFNNGQLVSLIGAEYTSYITEYRISNIDTTNNLLYFSNNDVNGTDITFNASDSAAINIKPLNILYRSCDIVSNTSDTIVCNLPISADIAYAVIGNTKTKYTIIQVSNTYNMVQLKLYGSDTVITNLTPNEFRGMTIYTYRNNVIASKSIIGASRNTHIVSVSNAIALCAGDCYIKYGGHGAILANSSSYLMNYNSTIIAGGSYHYINGTGRSAIIGGEYNKIINASVCAIISGSKNTITSAANCVIIGGNDNTIRKINDTTNCNNTVMIACDSKIADRSNALFTDSITLTERTLVLKDNLGTKTPQIGDALLVESVNGNVATVTWGNVTGGNDMTPIDINRDPTSIADYNTDPSKVVYSFNCDILYAKTGNCRKTIHLNNDTVYPIGTIIYIILFRVASATSGPNVVEGITIDCGGGSSYKFSSNSVGISCRTVAFQKVLAKEWLMLRAS